VPPLRIVTSTAPPAGVDVVSGPRDPAAFEALFVEHWPAVHAYARRRVTTAEDAHDVAAEAFAVAWRRLPDVPPDHALPWLYRTAANVLSNRNRGDRRRDRLTAKLAGQPSSAVSDPGDVAADDEIIVAAFDSLAEADREVLRLVAWEGLANAEIAAVLGVSDNAAALRVSRARQRLERAVLTQEAAAGHEIGDRHGSER
jgi:RNA polymerase sigma factor (sigma-70 family)